jgi:hypothetical protein
MLSLLMVYPLVDVVSGLRVLDIDLAEPIQVVQRIFETTAAWGCLFVPKFFEI